MKKDPKVTKEGTVPVINSKSSYPFISLINCPCLLFIVNFGLLNSFVGFIAFGFLYIIHYWIRDVIVGRKVCTVKISFGHVLILITTKPCTSERQ